MAAATPRAQRAFRLAPAAVVDRSGQLKSRVDYLQPITRRGVTISACANNPYAGFSPDTVKLFREYWDKKK